MTKRKGIHPRLKEKIFNRDNFKCVNCGVSGDFNCLEIDHIIPIRFGGSNEESNLQTLCYRCNMDKYGKKNIKNKFLLNLSPLEKLKIIKNKIDDYKNLTYAEFKIIFTQDEIFKKLRLNFSDVNDLYYEISGKKKQNAFNGKFSDQRNKLIYILRDITGMNLKELEDLFKKYKFDISYAQISRICANLDSIFENKDKKHGGNEEKLNKNDEKVDLEYDFGKFNGLTT